MSKTIKFENYIWPFLLFILSSGSIASEFSNESEVAMVKTGGNTDLETYKMDSESKYKFSKNILGLKLNYIYGETGNIRSAESWSIRGRYDRILNIKFSTFASELIEANRFAGIDRRYNTDLGLKYIIWDSDSGQVFVEAGYRYTYEKAENSPLENKDQKGRVYQESSYKLSSTTIFKFWVEYIPNFTVSEDYLVSMEPSLKVEINKIFALKTAYKWAYDNKPIRNNSAYDYTYTASLLANF